MTAIERALESGDAHRGVKKLAEIGEGKTRGISADDVLAALPRLDGVGVEFDPAGALGSARMHHDGDGYVLEEWPMTLADGWDPDCLSRHEAGALLEDGLRIRPVEVDSK